MLNENLLQEERLEEESKREGELVKWIEENKQKIEKFFMGREPDFEELMANIDSIEDYQMELEEQTFEEKTEKWFCYSKLFIFIE